jgi:outer membrane protein assembly factor BamB
VSAVSQAWRAKLDGQVYAEPLVDGDQVIAATENDTVYSLDVSTGQVVWSTSLGAPMPGSALPCGNIDSSGVTGTPVIDLTDGVVWVVAFVEPASISSSP